MRAAANDFMQNFRYHAVASDVGGNDVLQPTTEREQLDGAQAGFQSITIPELSVEIAEYREGTFKRTQKYPGPQTYGDMTLIRGITKADTAFYDMILSSIEGDDYRADVSILHYQRTEMSDASAGSKAAGFRRYFCENGFATRVKVAGDLEAMTGDVSLAEVDLAIEDLKIKYE